MVESSLWLRVVCGSKLFVVLGCLWLRVVFGSKLFIEAICG